MVTLLASAARTSSDVLVLPGRYDKIDSAQFLLTVSAAATEVGDLLDVFIQHAINPLAATPDWDDFVRFTQVLGNGGAKKYQAFWSRLAAPEAEMAAPQDGAMAAGVKQGPLGPGWRIKWNITDAGTLNASFTFKLEANLSRPQYAR